MADPASPGSSSAAFLSMNRWILPAALQLTWLQPVTREPVSTTDGDLYDVSVMNYLIFLRERRSLPASQKLPPSY